MDDGDGRRRRDVNRRYARLQRGVDRAAGRLRRRVARCACVLGQRARASRGHEFRAGLEARDGCRERGRGDGSMNKDDDDRSEMRY